MIEWQFARPRNFLIYSDDKFRFIQLGRPVQYGAGAVSQSSLLELLNGCTLQRALDRDSQPPATRSREHF